MAAVTYNGGPQPAWNWSTVSTIRLATPARARPGGQRAAKLSTLAEVRGQAWPPSSAFCVGSCWHTEEPWARCVGRSHFNPMLDVLMGKNLTEEGR
jgi:hypothetical protein